MPRVLVITNPRARGVRPDTLRAVRTVLLDGGWTAEIRATRSVAEIRRLAGSAADSGWDCLAVMGGDGTVIEALGSLVGSDVPVAVIPAGTGNLLAGNLGIPLAPYAAAGLIVRARTRRIDLGEVTVDGRTRHFVVAMGAGFDARVMDATRPTTKRRWGKAAYFVTAMALAPRIRRVPHRIEIDGVARELEASEVIIANFGELIPERLRPRQAVLPDDGLFDVIVLTVDGPVQGLLGVWETLSQRERGQHPGGRLFRTTAREVSVTAEPAQPVELDGDSWGSTPFTARVIPSAVSIVVPG